MMGTDAALESVFGQYISAPDRPKDAIYVDCSTVAPDLTASLAEQAKGKGVSYVSSPVFGRPDAAAAQQLLVVAAGRADAKAQVVACADRRQLARFRHRSCRLVANHVLWHSCVCACCLQLSSASQPDAAWALIRAKHNQQLAR